MIPRSGVNTCRSMCVGSAIELTLPASSFALPAEVSSRQEPAAGYINLPLHLLRGFDRFFNRTDHEERLLGKMIVLALDDFLEASHRLGNRDVFARFTSELLADEERLRHESLNASRAGDAHLVFFRQL